MNMSNLNQLSLHNEIPKPSLLKRVLGVFLHPVSFLTRLAKGAIHLPKNTAWFFKVWVWSILTFTGLLLFYLVYRITKRITAIRFFPAPIARVIMLPLSRFYSFLTDSSRHEERTINRVNLIELALRNMVFKKSRAIITVGGMSIGIGAIVFLVSIGYGMQRLVITRVARLDELLQADVNPQPGSREKINDSSIAKFNDVAEVAETLPLIASVARVTLNNSVSDVPVYGVTTRYLQTSAIKPIHGEVFDSNEIAVSDTGAKVAGISTEASSDEKNEKVVPSFGEEIEKTTVQIDEDSWVRVRKEPSTKGEILGYARAGSDRLSATKVWGDVYTEAEEKSEPTSDGEQYASWLKIRVPLWEQTPCESSDEDCAEGKYKKILSQDRTDVFSDGYIAQINVQVEQAAGGVLGTTTEEESELPPIHLGGLVLAESTSSADGAWVEIASESAEATKEKVSSVELASSAKRVAVVNTAMLKVLGMNSEEAVGKKIQASFIAVGDLLGKDEKVESVPSEYTIVAVVPDDKSPYFYVPFTDLRGIGIVNYSQIKIVAKQKDLLPKARQKIESMGFSTRSVADTVQQIDRLFATARILLAVLGMVALSVAALGMFNTLTVSLLERTREVGLMKAMGMKSHEVQELFLTESMVMGFFGGILGIGIGWGAGKFLGLMLSTLSLTKGQGFLDVSHLPPAFVIFIFLLSLTVGICTGIYPARRATRISALDALRYE